MVPLRTVAASLTARFSEDGKCKTYNPNHRSSFDGQYIILSIKWEQFALNLVNYSGPYAYDSISRHTRPSALITSTHKTLPAKGASGHGRSFTLITA